MYLIQLKQIKQAFKAGNLDQACQMLTSDDYLCQRKEGRELLNQLSDAFLQRAEAHLKAGRYLQARLDCDNAKKCNIDNPGVSEFIDSLETAEKESMSRQKQHEANLKNANKFMDEGKLTMGMRFLDDHESLPGASLLRQQAELRQQQLQDIAAKLERAIAGCDIDYVLQLVTDLSSKEQSSSMMTSLVKNAREMILGQIKSDFVEGRLTRLVVLLEKSRSITADSIEFAEWYDLLNCYQKASVKIDNADYRGALKLLKRVKAIEPDAIWLNELFASVEKAIQAIDDIQMNMPVLNCTNDIQPKPKAKAKPEKMQRANLMDKPDKNYQLLNIDGAGSYMLFAGDKVTIGPISSIEKKDIAIIAPPNSPLVDIYKDDEDYFAKASSGDIGVNGRSFREALLSNGDKISVSDRGQVKFNRVNPASTTAIIDLSGVRLPQADIRAAIIADSEVIIGSSSSAHIKCKDCENDIVLKVNSKGYLEKDGQKLVPGTNVEYGKIRLCLV